MRDKVTQSTKDIVQDRASLGFILVSLAVMSVFVIYTGLGVQVQDMPVVTHYTAFGSQHLYDTSWLDVLAFPIFGILTTAIHCLLFIKLRQLKGTRIAFSFGFISLMVLFIGFFVARQVLRVASL